MTFGQAKRYTTKEELQMKSNKLLTQIRESFREDSKYKVLLLSILITGLSYGLYKGMLDNFLAEVV